MKIILIILLASFITLLGLLKFEGYLNFTIVNLIEINDIFEVNLGFIKEIISYVLYIPDSLYETKRELIYNLFVDKVKLSDTEIYSLIIFMYHFIYISIIMYVMSFFPHTRDRKLVVLGSSILYLIFIYLMINT